MASRKKQPLCVERLPDEVEEFLGFYKGSFQGKKNGGAILDADAGDGRRTLQIAEGAEGAPVLGMCFSGKDQQKALKLHRNSGSGSNVQFLMPKKQKDEETGRTIYSGEFNPGQFSAIYLRHLRKDKSAEEMSRIFDWLRQGGIFYTRLEVSALASPYKTKDKRRLSDKISLLESLFDGEQAEYQVSRDGYVYSPRIRVYRLTKK